MKRNNLSLKEATKLSIARYNSTKNPFIIYHLYDILENTIKDHHERESLKRLVLSLSRDMEVSLTFISLIFQTFCCIVRGIIKTTKTILKFFSIRKSPTLYRCSYLYTLFSTFTGNRRAGTAVAIVWWALISSVVWHNTICEGEKCHNS